MSEKRGAKRTSWTTALSKEDTAYIAGFVDADGSMMVNTGVTMVIANCHLPTLEWMRERLGGTVSELQAGKRNSAGITRQCFRLVLYGDNCRRACRLLHPYLRLKQREAELLLSWGDLAPNSEARDLVREELKKAKRAEYQL